MVVATVKFKTLRLFRIILDLLANIIGFRWPTRQKYLPKITDRVLLQPAVVLADRIKRAELLSEDVVRAYIDRIKSVQPDINALVQDNFADAIIQARDVDQLVKEELAGLRQLTSPGDSVMTKPFLGVPFTTKDSIGVQGMIQTSGLYHRKHIVAEDDCEVVKNLKQAGAIFIGLTNVPELVMWWDSYNKIFGRTHNPYDWSRIVGGSSGGESAILSSAGSVIGIGADIGGSIRMPSYFCGIFGHKTTPEVVSTKGHYPRATPKRERLLSCGPMCRYASDLKPMLKVMAGDNAGKLQLDQPVELNKLKIFYMEGIDNPILSPVDPDVAGALKNAVKYFESKSITAKRVHLKLARRGFEMWLAAMNDESAPKMTEELMNLNGRINPFLELVKCLFGLSKHTFCAIVSCFADIFLPVAGTRRKKLDEMRQSLTKELHQLLGDDGVLLFPSHPEPAPKHNATLLKLFNVTYTALFNPLFVAITQVPMGLSQSGLPVGLQIIVGPYQDRLSIAVAEELEKAFGGWVQPS